MAANGAIGVTGVSRSLVWLNPDHVSVYDRGTTKIARPVQALQLGPDEPADDLGQYGSKCRRRPGADCAVADAGRGDLVRTAFLDQLAVAGVPDAEHPRDRQRPADHRGQER